MSTATECCIRCALWVALAAGSKWPVAKAQQAPPLPNPEELRANEAHREKFQKTNEVLKILRLKDGDWVADVGAGWGFFTVRMAPVAGKTGRVFAVELKQELISFIQERASGLSPDNIQCILGRPDDPRLPAARLDSVLIVNSYHEMEQYESMLKQIFRSLKRGGRLVMIEPSQKAHRDWTRQKQIENNELAPVLAEHEIRTVGFEIIEHQDSFIPSSKELKDFAGPGGWWMIVAKHPD